MTASHYDVVCVGCTLSSQVCAALLAKRGLRVLLVGQRPLASHYTLGPYRVPRVPQVYSHYHSPFVQSLFTELALQPYLRRHAHPLSMPLQWLGPRHRVDIYTDPRRTLEELQRAFPYAEWRHAEALLQNFIVLDEALATLFQHIPPWAPQGLREKSRWSSAFESLPMDIAHDTSTQWHTMASDHPLKQLIANVAGVSSHAPVHTLTVWHLAHLWNAWVRGAWMTEQEEDFLHEQLLHCFFQANGEYLPDESMDRIVLNKQEVSGVHLRLRDTVVGAQRVLWALPTQALASLTTTEATASPKPQLNDVTDLGQRLTVNLIAPAESIPDQLKSCAIINGSQVDPQYAQLLKPMRPALDEEATENTVALCIQGLTHRGHGADSGAARDAFVRNVAEIFPLAVDHALVVDSPHDGLDAQHFRGDPIDVDRSWERGPYTMPGLSDSPAQSTPLGLWGMPIQHQWNRLLLCNNDVAPGFGTGGEYLVAAMVADRICRIESRKARMRRSSWVSRRL